MNVRPDFLFSFKGKRFTLQVYIPEFVCAWMTPKLAEQRHLEVALKCDTAFRMARYSDGTFAIGFCVLGFGCGAQTVNKKEEKR